MRKLRIYLDTSVVGGYSELEIRSPKDLINYEE